MRPYLFLSALVSCFFVISAAQAVQFNIDGQSYDNITDAVAAVQNKANTAVKGIKPSSRKLVGTTAFIIPKQESIKESYLKKQGEKISLEFAAHVFETILLSDAEAVSQSQVFEKVDIVRADSLAEVTGNYDHLIFQYPKRHNGWVIMEKSTKLAHDITVSENQFPITTEHLQNFVKAVAEAGDELGIARR